MPETLRRALSLFQLCVYGVGIIVGAGIYAVIGAAAGEAGNALWISFAMAAVIAGVTALSYAELAAMFPKAGAEYEFFRQAFPGVRALAFAAGAMTVVNTAATVATVTLAFGGYLGVYVAVPVVAGAFALLVVTTLVNIAGIRQATWGSVLLVAVEVGALLLIAGFGAAEENWGRDLALPDQRQLPGVLSAAALIFFAYVGFEDVANLAEEAKNPERDIPRALIISVVVTGVLYAAVALAALAAVSPQQLAASDAPLETAARAIAPWLGNALAFAALFATASTALISLVSKSRVLFGMARGGDLPQLLGRTLTRRQTPWVAALVLAAIVCTLLPLGEVEIAASVSSLTILLVFIGVQTSLIFLRFTNPDAKRPFRVPLNWGKLPLVPVLGILLCLALLTQFSVLAWGVAGLLIAGIVAVYFLYGAFGRRTNA